MEYFSASTKTGINQSINHIKLVNEVIGRVESGENFADVVFGLEEDGKLKKGQIAPMVKVILSEKFKFFSSSFTVSTSRGYKELEKYQREFCKWTKFDIVLVFFHPQLGVTLINPSNWEHWENLSELLRYELLVVYLQAFDEKDAELEAEVYEDVRSMILKGYFVGSTNRYIGPVRRAVRVQTVPEDAALIDAEVQTADEQQQPSAQEKQSAVQEQFLMSEPKSSVSVADKPPKKTAPAAKNKESMVKMTPKYSCQVTNELFHNGNVEAWKNIIDAYQKKYEKLSVCVYHDGSLVKNLNSLFKWGKVKHGDVILFSVAGSDFKGISKLQRYLFEGASNRFEQFLKKDLNKPLQLF